MPVRISAQIATALVLALLWAGSAQAAPSVPTSVQATRQGSAVELAWSGSLAASTPTATRAAIAPPLWVDGTVLRDQSAQRVGLTGVAVQMMPYYAGATPTTQQPYLAQVAERNFEQRDAEFAAIRSLGYDAIRVHIPGPSVYESELYESKAATVARVQSIVDSAKRAGLITILDADATGDRMANWRDYEPMFADLIASIGNDPWVIWEPFNEPADYAPGAPTYTAAVKGIGSYLRSLGSLQPLILPSDGYEQEVSRVLMDNILGDAKTHGWRAAGLLFGVHVYLDQYAAGGDTFTGVPFDALQQGIASIMTSYPLIVTEMGRYNNGITMTNATAKAYRWVAGLGATGLNGLIGWDWDWTLNQATSDPNAWTWDGLHLKPWGQESSAGVSSMTFPELTTTSAALSRTLAGASSPSTGAVPRSARAVAPRSRQAVVRGRVLRIVFKTPIRWAARIRLTIVERSSHHVITVSRIVRIPTGGRVLRWKLPRAVAGARSFTLRATYLPPGRGCSTGACWRPLARWVIRRRPSRRPARASRR